LYSSYSNSVMMGTENFGNLEQNSLINISYYLKTFNLVEWYENKNDQLCIHICWRSADSIKRRRQEFL